MNENIIKHFEMKLLWKNKRFMDSEGKIKEVYVQPERSKREDIEDLGHDFVTVGCTDHRYCIKCNEEDHVIKSTMMRCSEHYGKIL